MGVDIKHYTGCSEPSKPVYFTVVLLNKNSNITVAGNRCNGRVDGFECCIQLMSGADGLLLHVPQVPVGRECE